MSSGSRKRQRTWDNHHAQHDPAKQSPFQALEEEKRRQAQQYRSHAGTVNPPHLRPPNQPNPYQAVEQKEKRIVKPKTRMPPIVEKPLNVPVVQQRILPPPVQQRASPMVQSVAHGVSSNPTAGFSHRPKEISQKEQTSSFQALEEERRRQAQQYRSRSLPVNYYQPVEHHRKTSNSGLSKERQPFVNAPYPPYPPFQGHGPSGYFPGTHSPPIERRLRRRLSHTEEMPISQYGMDRRYSVPVQDMLIRRRRDSDSIVMSRQLENLRFSRQAFDQHGPVVPIGKEGQKLHNSMQSFSFGTKASPNQSESESDASEEEGRLTPISELLKEIKGEEKGDGPTRIGDSVIHLHSDKRET